MIIMVFSPVCDNDFVLPNHLNCIKSMSTIYFIQKQFKKVRHIFNCCIFALSV